MLVEFRKILKFHQKFDIGEIPIGEIPENLS